MRKRGRALVSTVYRGIGKKLSGAEYSSDPGDLGRGVYYSSSRSYAKLYGKLVGPHSRPLVVQRKVVVRNPKVIGNQEFVELRDKYGTVWPEWSLTATDDDFDRLEALHDLLGPEAYHAKLLADRLAGADRMRKGMLREGFGGVVHGKLSNVMGNRAPNMEPVEIVVYSPESTHVLSERAKKGWATRYQLYGKKGRRY
jgi:hypothetical protein